jgi:hypothetical protein
MEGLIWMLCGIIAYIIAKRQDTKKNHGCPKSRDSWAKLFAIIMLLMCVGPLGLIWILFPGKPPKWL